MSDLYTYDPQESVLVWDDHEVVAFMEGTMVTASHIEEQSSLHVGAKGSGTVVASANRSGEFSFTISQSSPSNDFLSAAVAEHYSTGIIRIAPILLRRLNSDEQAAASLAWVVGPPELSHAMEVEGREWTIRCLDMEIFAGGGVAL